MGALAIDSSSRETPPDFVYLLIRDHHIQEPSQAEKFVEFAEQALTVISEYCSTPLPHLAELQVACALLPGKHLLIEVQTDPPEIRLVHAKGITSRLRELEVPSLKGRPVMISRRMRFGHTAEGSCALPFASFANSERPTPLDETLLEAAGVRAPSSSLWEQVKLFFEVERRPPPIPPGLPGIAATLSTRTGIMVLSSTGQFFLAGSPHLPFTITNDKTARGGVAAIKYSNGASGVVDKLYLDYLRSRAPQPTQVRLDHLLANVARVRVIDGGMASGRPLGDKVLLDVTGELDLTELKQGLSILDGPGGHCMCCGDTTLELLSRNNKRLAVLGLHHGHSVRWAAWKDDAELIDGRRLLDWLAKRGVPFRLPISTEGMG